MRATERPPVLFLYSPFTRARRVALRVIQTAPPSSARSRHPISNHIVPKCAVRNCTTTVISKIRNQNPYFYSTFGWLFKKSATKTGVLGWVLVADKNEELCPFAPFLHIRQLAWRHRLYPKMYLKMYHLTQRELSEKSGVGLRFVRDLEQGKPTLRMDKVNQVLAMFGAELGPVDLERNELWNRRTFPIRSCHKICRMVIVNYYVRATKRSLGKLLPLLFIVR